MSYQGMGRSSCVAALSGTGAGPGSLQSWSQYSCLMQQGQLWEPVAGSLRSEQEQVSRGRSSEARRKEPWDLVDVAR